MSVSLLLCLQQLRWWFAKLLLTTHQSDHRDKMDQPECVLERFWPISVPVWNSPKRESSDSSLGLPVRPWPIRACALCKGKLKWTTVGKGVGGRGGGWLDPSKCMPVHQYEDIRIEGSRYLLRDLVSKPQPVKHGVSHAIFPERFLKQLISRIFHRINCLKITSF